MEINKIWPRGSWSASSTRFLKAKSRYPKNNENAFIRTVRYSCYWPRLACLVYYFECLLLTLEGTPGAIRGQGPTQTPRMCTCKRASFMICLHICQSSSVCGVQVCKSYFSWGPVWPCPRKGEVFFGCAVLHRAFRSHLIIIYFGSVPSLAVADWFEGPQVLPWCKPYIWVLDWDRLCH